MLTFKTYIKEEAEGEREQEGQTPFVEQFRDDLRGMLGVKEEGEPDSDPAEDEFVEQSTLAELMAQAIKSNLC